MHSLTSVDRVKEGVIYELQKQESSIRPATE